jgi:hypothetical protein
MQLALADSPPSTGDLWRAFPRWINTHYRSFHGRLFEAVEHSDRVPPELAVTVWDGSVPVATYKCSMLFVRGPDRIWIALAPLVVVWTARQPANGFELGRIMVDHLCTAARRFHRAHGTDGEGLLIASGNLTEEKGGARFFGALGWEVAAPRHCERAGLGHGDPDLLPALAAIERVIEEAVAPLRGLGKIGDEPLSFAFRPL